jgi:exopolysaccharide biosynthesis protein
LKSSKKGTLYSRAKGHAGWLWNGKGENKKEKSPAKLAAISGKSRRTIIREMNRGKTTQRRSPDREAVGYYGADLGQLRADENRQNHGPMEKIWHDYILAAALLVLLSASSCVSGPRVEVFEFREARLIGEFEPQWRELTAGLAVTSGKIRRPRLEFWALRVDLTDQNMEITVNDAESDQDWPAGTIPAVTVTGFAAAYGCIAAMNAGPFFPVSDKAGERRTLTGVFISNGRMVSPPVSRYDCLVFYDDGRAAVLPQAELASVDGVRHALGGFFTVLDGGRLTERGTVSGNTRHPRSAAAVSGGGRVLYLLVVDGRRPGSVGTTETETGLLLSALGAESGLLMDGGGSSALALELDGKISAVNRPVHGGIAGRERAVATCIGLRRRSPAPLDE